MCRSRIKPFLHGNDYGPSAARIFPFVVKLGMHERKGGRGLVQLANGTIEACAGILRKVLTVRFANLWTTSAALVKEPRACAASAHHIRPNSVAYEERLSTLAA